MRHLSDKKVTEVSFEGFLAQWPPVVFLDFVP